ncbi:hypothetical protein N0V88_007154 [Collariella sp. IMI 366227]|nr:hypothetical protein N0V88_007154 [Collariella sp. IMI 366227]
MNAHRADDIEAEPLLAPEDRDSIEIVDSETGANEVPIQAESDHGASAFPRSHRRRGFASFGARFQAQKHSSIVLLLAVLMFAVVTSGMLILIPIFRLMEDAICHAYYKKGMFEPIDERLCKVEGVQKELAYLGALLGRKLAFTLAYAGTVLAFGWGPLMLVIGDTPHVYLAPLGSIFFIIGGGIPAAMNTLHSMVSDISSEAER